MIKKTMLAAFAVALAFAALPALASAMHPNPFLVENKKAVDHRAFTIGTDPKALEEEESEEKIPGYHPRLETVGGKFVECEHAVGKGEFVTAETGWLELTFTENCHTTLGIKCTSEGQSTGTIQTPTLPFHLKTVDHQGEGEPTPGVLITPSEEPDTPHGHLFVKFKCSFAGTVEVGGATPDPESGSTPGIVGTITSPGEKTPSKTATLSFKQTAGTQTHRTVTNDSEETKEYDLKSSFNGGATETAGETAKGTITFAEGEPEIRTTGESIEE